MKITKYLIVTSLGVLAACSDNENVTPEEGGYNGTTHASLRFTLEQPATKADPNQYDNTGRAADNKLNDLTLISSQRNQWSFSDSATTDGTKFWKKTDNVYTVNPFTMGNGNQIMGLLINGNNNDALMPFYTQAPTALFGEANQVVANIATLSSDNSFVMTSKVETKNVKDGITEAEAKAANDETHNAFSFETERVVAGGMVILKKELIEGKTQVETTDALGDIEVASVKYAAINGAVPTYIYANKAGKRQLENGAYASFESAIHNWTEFASARNPENVKDKLIRLGNIDTTSADNLGGYKPQQAFQGDDAPYAQAANSNNSRIIYFLENSVDNAAMLAGKHDGGFYRLAYAKVYAKFIPKKIFILNDNGDLELVDFDPSHAKINDNGDFFKGLDDQALYASREAAKKSPAAPGQQTYRYKGGKCAYRALWNHQTGSGETLTYADVRRNNIYRLTVASFETLGMPWDPADPKDPDLPKDPDDPDVPPVNPDPDDTDTYIKVEAKILPWNVVSREVDLK